VFNFKNQVLVRDFKVRIPLKNSDLLLKMLSLVKVKEREGYGNLIKLFSKSQMIKVCA
jgi:hypothetical protein